MQSFFFDLKSYLENPHWKYLYICKKLINSWNIEESLLIDPINLSFNFVSLFNVSIY